MRTRTFPRIFRTLRTLPPAEKTFSAKNPGWVFAKRGPAPSNARGGAQGTPCGLRVVTGTSGFVNRRIRLVRLERRLASLGALEVREFGLSRETRGHRLQSTLVIAHGFRPVLKLHHGVVAIAHGVIVVHAKRLEVLHQASLEVSRSRRSTAVSTSPLARHAGKYSCGRRPPKIDPDVSPARGPVSWGWKHGRVLPLVMRGTRRPSLLPETRGDLREVHHGSLGAGWRINDSIFRTLLGPGQHLLTVDDVTLLSASLLRMSSVASAPRARADAWRSVREAPRPERARPPRRTPPGRCGDGQLLPAPTSLSGRSNRSSIPHVMPYHRRYAVSRAESAEMKSPARTRPWSRRGVDETNALPKRFLSRIPAHTKLRRTTSSPSPLVSPPQ